MKAVRIHEYGGPEAMKLEELPGSRPGPDQALVKLEASGVNFIDIYQRSGAYKGNLPFGLGLEGAGTVEAVGSNAVGVAVGDRVAWTACGDVRDPQHSPHVAQLIKLPDGGQRPGRRRDDIQG